nr:hypothetical protein [Arthrobacter sp. ISL-30]
MGSGAQCPEDGHGLGHAEGQVEADDGVARFGSAVAVLDDCGSAVRTAQGGPGVRVDRMVKDGFRIGFGDGVSSGAADAGQA